MLFTILISIVFIAEMIIAVALIRAILRLDKAICEVNDTVVLAQDGIKDISELVHKISEQMVDLANDYVNRIKRYQEEAVMKQLYPEIYACIGCNACTKVCPQELNVKQYIAYAQRGDFKSCAEESFECIMCGVCSSRCPAGISQPQVAMLARRINGKYLALGCEHLEERVREIKNGTFTTLIEALMNKPLDEMKELYNSREIEK